MELGMALGGQLTFAKQWQWLRRVFFGDPARRFAWASLVLLIVLVSARTSDYFNQWRYYQRAYRKLIQSRPNAAALQSRMESGVQQIWIPERGIVDRCQTCHTRSRNLVV
jgi:hypothetical protein